MLTATVWYIESISVSTNLYYLATRIISIDAEIRHINTVSKLKKNLYFPGSTTVAITGARIDTGPVDKEVPIFIIYNVYVLSAHLFMLLLSRYADLSSFEYLRKN